jgi:hypothetical protein
LQLYREREFWKEVDEFADIWQAAKIVIVPRNPSSHLKEENFFRDFVLCDNGHKKKE